MADFYRDVTRELRQAQYKRLPKRGKGDHEVWECELNGHKTTVPFNLKSKHTANGIMKSCKLAKRF